MHFDLICSTWKLRIGQVLWYMSCWFIFAVNSGLVFAERCMMYMTTAVAMAMIPSMPGWGVTCVTSSRSASQNNNPYKIHMSPQGAHGFYREIVQAAMRTQGSSLVVKWWIFYFVATYIQVLWENVHVVGSTGPVQSTKPRYRIRLHPPTVTVTKIKDRGSGYSHLR